MIDEEAEHVLTGEIGPQLVLWDLMKTHKTDSDGQWISGIWASADKALVHQDGLSLWDLSTGHASQILKPGSYVVTAAPGAGVWAIARWLSYRKPHSDWQIRAQTGHFVYGIARFIPGDGDKLATLSKWQTPAGSGPLKGLQGAKCGGFQHGLATR